jgi:hypothetical protein
MVKSQMALFTGSGESYFGDDLYPSNPEVRIGPHLSEVLADRPNGTIVGNDVGQVALGVKVIIIPGDEELLPYAPPLPELAEI